MRYAILPAEVSQELGARVQYVQKISHNEYSSSCPKCGGSPHPDGSLPDRFRIFIRSRATGGPLAWCRSCGFKWWPGRADKKEISPEDLAKMEAERVAYEEFRKNEVSALLDQLNKSKSWEKYHADLNDVAIKEYNRRLITEYWIEYWCLGYCPDKTILDQNTGEYLHVPSLTIPIFDHSGRALNVKHRLIGAPAELGKYRSEVKDIPAALFVADRDRKSGACLVLEGEFKAMTTYIVLDDPSMQVVGIPSKRPASDLLDQLRAFNPIYVCLDPDAYVVNRKSNEKVSAVARLASLIPGSFIMTAPYKIDDMIIDGALGKREIKGLMRSAKKGS